MIKDTVFKFKVWFWHGIDKSKHPQRNDILLSFSNTFIKEKEKNMWYKIKKTVASD